MKCVCNIDFIPKRINQVWCSVKCGNRVRSKTWRALGRESELRQTPKGKYHLHKNNAKGRNIEFNLTFEEWWSVWKDHWSKDIHGKLCMCRTKDIGPYELGNVRIDTWQNNYREARGLPLLT